MTRLDGAHISSKISTQKQQVVVCVCLDATNRNPDLIAHPAEHDLILRPFPVSPLARPPNCIMFVCAVELATWLMVLLMMLVVVHWTAVLVGKQWACLSYIPYWLLSYTHPIPCQHLVKTQNLDDDSFLADCCHCCRCRRYYQTFTEH